MKLKLFGVVVFTVIFLACFAGLENNGIRADIAAMQFAESQLTLNNANQQNPDIYQYGYNNYAVVWQDDRNGKWDIYMYYQKYLGAGNWDVQWDNRITANTGGNNINPKIYNDTIVYQSDRKGNWDIFMYNLTSNVETQITTNTANQEYPAIHNNTIVWQDWRNMWWTNPYNDLWRYPGMDIYMYNLTSHTEQALPLAEDACFKPAISRDRVVYVAEKYWTSTYSGISYYYPYVCAYSLTSMQESTITTGAMRDLPMYSSTLRALSSPALDGPITAWSESAGDVGVLTDGVIWRSSGVSGPGNPDVSGQYVAYQGIVNGNWDIYLYDSTSNTAYDATTNAAGQQKSPSISTGYANFIAYQDDRSGNWHIYLSTFWHGVMSGFPSPDPHTPGQVVISLQQVENRIEGLPTSAFAGANDKVKENRRNAMLNQLDLSIASIDAAVNTQNLKIQSKCLQSAIDQLNDLINKVDGSSQRGSADVAGSGFTPDWIIVQQNPYQSIMSARIELQTLLNSIS